MGASASLPLGNELNADQQVKIYRQMVNEQASLSAANTPPDQAYEKLVQKHSELVKLYSTTSFQCPKVRFGRTELQMPILTCGGMRQQQTWAPGPDMTLEQVNKECQENFEKIVARSMELGINHFETARAYGSSELQYGPILKKYNRSDYILQTKVPPKADPAEFRKVLETSFATLQMDQGNPNEYLDLFGFHGINKPEHLEWIRREGGCMEVINEYKEKGLIKHVGFSTHGMTPTIVEAIETGLFDYVNLHYHFVGSYTATGTGPLGGNLAAVQAARKQDMGVFIISPSDKGGALYEPPQALVNACAPLTPIAFNELFLWSSDESQAPIHTLVVGAARPADFDEHMQAAMLYEQRKEIVAPIEAKLSQLVADKFGPDFKATWFEGLPDAYQNPEGLPIGNLYWLYWIIVAWGMYGYALKRYTPLEGSLKGWDDSKSPEENQKAFSWVPGVGYRPEREAQLREILKDHPRGEVVVEAIKALHSWMTAGGCLARGEKPSPAQGPGSVDINPAEWVTAYDLQPQLPFPERK